MKAFWAKLRFILKNWLNLPVYRKDILKYAIMHSYRNYNDIKWALKDGLLYFGLEYSCYELSIYEVFPDFGKDVEKFSKHKVTEDHWWDKGDWRYEQMENYFSHLIELHKDDKTNLRIIEQNAEEKYSYRR